MRALLLFLLMVSCCQAQYAYNTNLCRFPYRKVGDRYYSLAPQFKWYIQNTHAKEPAKCPMPEWGNLLSEYSGLYKVDAVRADGLIIRETYYGANGSSDRDPIFLRNYPYFTNMVDGQRIEFFALSVGSYKYGPSTLKAYDFGIPYDPQKLANETKTNQPSPSVTVTNVANK